MTARAAVCVLTILAVSGLVACGSTKHVTATRGDPPRLVLWKSIGDIRLGEPMAHVVAEYGHEGPYGYRFHGGTVDVEDNFGPGPDVNWIYFTSRYYRTKTGFGVGSTFPKRWRRAFIYNPTLKADPCRCWVKIGAGKRSLPLTRAKFGIPWVIVYLSHGRVRGILMSSKYVD